MFDLTLFPLTLDAGREQGELPCLLVAAAPRKTARMRAQDVLILLMGLTTPAGDAVTLSAAQQQEMLNRLAETYFKTPGSVTAGLRAVVTRLNDYLFSRNLRARHGEQMIGTLNLAVLHRDFLMLAHGGPTHSFFLDKTRSQHFVDSPGQRGLGLSRQAAPRFYQAALAANDILIFCSDPPPAWEHNLGSAQNLTLDRLRPRLIGETDARLKAAVVRFTTGNGQVNYWRPGEQAGSPAAPALRVEQASPAAAPAVGRQAAESELPAVQVGLPETPGDSLSLEEQKTASAAEEPASPELMTGQAAQAETSAPGGVVETFAPVDPPGTQEEPQVPSDAGAAEYPADSHRPVHLQAAPVLEESVLSPEEAPAGAVEDASQPAPPAEGIRLSHAVSRPVESGSVGAARRPQAGAARPAAQPPARPRAAAPARPAGPPPSEVLRRRLAPAWRRGSAARTRMGGVFSRLFPQRSEPLINLSPSAMLMIAILVPFLIGTVGAVVYFRLGRSERFDILFSQAQQYAAQASQLGDPAQQREGWKRVLEMVGEAEKYGSSEESEALRQQAQGTLDELEGYVRLDFRPASGSSFEQSVKITRILAKLNQVYLLDSSQGRILSMTRITTGGYEINSFFNCGPGRAGGTFIGPLVDLAELPVNNDLNAEVLGIDAGGNLIYCAANKSGFDSRPLALPDMGWGEIVGMATYNDILYVLDPKANAVYWYSGERGIYADPPHLYFDEEIPQMGDVIDLAIDQEFLYLLHKDGRMTICSSGGVSFATTRCTDPAPYGDGRAGYEPSPLVFPGAQFTQIQTTAPPDPSLFALDPQNTSIYHLSQRRMNLQRQYRPLVNSDYMLPRKAPTAFAISPNRRALIAFDNLVFFSALP